MSERDDTPVNTKQLDLALDLSRTLNYRKTAENMFISQPALTHQIKALEAELGVQLFRRSSQGVALTPAGELFCRDMTQIMQRARETVISVRNCSASGYSDTLHVGLNVTRTLRQVSEVVRRFSAEYPSVLLDIHQDAGIARLDAFLRNEFDIVFFTNEAIPTALNVSKLELFGSRIYCVVPADHPLAEKKRVEPKDLAGETVMLFQGKGLSVLARAQAALLERAAIRQRFCHDTEVALLWVSVLRGAALMPGFCYRDDSQFAWIPYACDSTIPSGLAWHSDDQRPFVSGFVNIAAAVFHEHALKGSVM